MKPKVKFTVLLLTMLFTALMTTGAKPKQINLSKFLIYQGEVDKKIPQGEGLITCNPKNFSTSPYTISGVFDADSISEGKLSLYGWNFSGTIHYTLAVQKFVLIRMESVRMKSWNSPYCG